MLAKSCKTRLKIILNIQT